MLLPNGGRVVIIDNELKEAMPLITALNKRGSSCLYFDGSQDKLPDEPVAGTRFVFLDIQLDGGAGQSVKNLISSLLGVLQKIIDPNNGPYIIVFWTNHEEHIAGVLEGCSRKGIAPVGHLSLDKSVIDDQDNIDISAIWTNINTEVETAPAFQLINQWENIVNSSTIKFVNEFCKHFDTGADWSEQALRIFYKLYKKSIGLKKTENTAEQLMHALSLLNRSFFETIESSNNGLFEFPEQFKLADGEISPEVLSKINTSLNININLLGKSQAGLVYLVSNDELRDHLANSLFEKGKHPAAIELCQIVTTPECDIAQDKLLKDKSGDESSLEYHRVVHALMWKWDTPYDEKIEKKREKKSTAIYPISKIYYADSIQSMLCHFSSLSYCKSTEFAGEPLFSLRRELLADLQTKSANNANRLGNYQI